ncbi:MAG TPA: Hsp20/alpha crystallin family protein [Cyclobacteriaceae bacterium]|nr:Hsp20/alpha crystallin family protein [Cyclobacteriaceae bacterium]
MSLIKRNSDWPLLNGSLLSNFFDNNRFFDSSWLKEHNVPAVNVKETDKSFEVELAAPGLTKKDFNISVDDHLLTISSEKKSEKEEKEKGYTRKEFNYSSFSRSFALPENVNENDVKAKYEDGVLKLSLTKKGLPETKAKKMIEVG